MNIINVDSLEKRKAAYLETHEKRLVDLYTKEMHKVMTWFVKKYPKRRLEWVSGMGTFYWYLDGKPLDCADLETDFNHWMQLSNCYGSKPKKPCRIMQRLMPLWDFYNSIRDHTHVPMHWIDIGDFSSDDYKEQL